MTNNSKFDRYFFVLGGATMTSGGSLNLAKGQIGVFSMKRANQNGQEAVSTFAGRDKNEDYTIKVGRGDISVTRSTSNKSMSSVPFSLRDIKSVGVSAPKTTEQTVDDVILGYNGIDADTAITLLRGDRKKITVELSGNLVGMYGYPDNKVVTSVYLDPEKYFETEVCEEGDNCEPVNARPYVLDAIEELRRFQLIGGVPFSDLVDITPVERSVGAVAPETEDRFYQSLTVNDTGDQAALAMVQAQYPDNKIVRISQSGITSVYQTMTETNALLADYVQTIDSLIKGCEDCPAGYTELVAGVVYRVLIEDDGTDLSTTVDNLPGYIANTVAKLGQDGGTGSYVLAVDNELTDAEIATFIATNATTATAQVILLGDVTALCTNATTTATDWVLGDTCQVAIDNYTIVLADDECGNNILAELQAHYPFNTITVAESDESTQTVTLTGTSGTANVNIGGTDYLATFATSLTVTATNFVTTHATALAAEGITVTSDGAVLTFTGPTAAFPAATTNATGDLDATDAAPTVVPVTGGCQTKYNAEVITNMVCEECDPIFVDFFTSEPPLPYNGNEWVKVEPAEPTSSLMGIRFRGKKFEIRSNEYLRDKIGFEDSSVMIRVTGGELDEVRAGIGELKNEPMAVTYLSRWAPRTHMGGGIQWLEERERMYFTGEEPCYSALTRVLFTGEESVIDQSKQYIDYTIDVVRDTYAQQPAGRHHEAFTYHIFCQVGQHEAVENLVNALAGAAGISGIRAFADN